MFIKGNPTPLSEDFLLKAQEANQAPADHQPRMAMELLQDARNTLNSIHAVTTQPTTSESREVLATFQDKSAMSIKMVGQTLQGQNSRNPDQEATLTGPDGHPLSWRSLMDNLSRHNTVARKTVEAHLGHGPHNPLDTGELESAAWEVERHAVNVMDRLPLECWDCFQHLADIPCRAVYTALMQDGSRVAWVRSAGARGLEPRWKQPLAVAAIPPDPRLTREELRRHGNCSICGGVAVQEVNARRIRAEAYGLDVDEIFCLACLGEGREFLEECAALGARCRRWGRRPAPEFKREAETMSDISNTGPTTQERGNYRLQLASNLKRLEELDDREGMKQLWETYGHSDCLQAEKMAADHDGPLPPPNVWEGSGG